MTAQATTKKAPRPAAAPKAKPVEKAPAKPAAKPVAAKAPAKPAPKPVEKAEVKSVAKPLPKPAPKPEPGTVPAKATKANAANNLAGAFGNRYRQAEVKEAFAAKALYVFGPTSFGPITGWNNLGSPVSFDQVSKHGDPSKVKALTAKTGTTIGIRGDYLEDADHIAAGTLVYVYYVPADPETDDPEDQPGWYAANVVKVGKAGVTVVFANVPEAGEHRYRWPEMVAEPAAIA